MQKGVSAILASVLIVLITVSLSGAFLVYTQRTATQLTETGTAAQQTFVQQTAQPFRVESFSGQTIWIRNLGASPLNTTTLSFFVDDVLASHTDTTIAANGLGTVNITNLWLFGPGFHNLRVSGGALSDFIRFETVPNEGSVLYFKFDEGSGTTTIDHSGKSNNGNLINSPAWVDGRFGKALNFNAVNTYVSTNTLSGFPAYDPSPLPALTYAAWFKSATTAGETVIATGSRSAVLLNRPTASTVFFHECQIPGDTSVSVNWVNLNDGNWHFVSVSYSSGGTTLSVTVDSTTVTTTTSGGQPTAANVAWIGKDICDNSQVFNGNIDEVLVFNRAYKPEELYVMRRG